MSTAQPWQGRKVHFVGIGGAGMSGLALIALELGSEVSGSDTGSPAVLTDLKARGAKIFDVHEAPNVPADADVVHSSAVNAANPEVGIAVERGQALLHRSELLAELTSLKRTIAVTGTHGKTTTSAMVLRALRGAGIDAGWVIGAGLQDSEASAGWGNSEWLVVEADESDRSLLVLNPEVAVVTNLELDHHATYSSFDDLVETVAKFAGDADQVVLSDGVGLDSLRSINGSRSVTPEGASSDGGKATFTWRDRKVRLKVPGLHNASNAAVALEAASLATDNVDGLVSGVEEFKGTSRRFELKGTTNSGAIVYDDYAHHPTEVAATIAAARTLGASRVVAAFQPHLFSRTEELAQEFAAALATADLALVADVYPARETQSEFPDVSAETISRLAADGVRSSGSLDDLLAELKLEVGAGDLVLLMGAGDVWTVAEGLVDVK